MDETKNTHKIVKLPRPENGPQNCDEAEKRLRMLHNTEETNLIGFLRQITNANRRKLLLESGKYMAWQDVMEIEQKGGGEAPKGP